MPRDRSIVAVCFVILAGLVIINMSEAVSKTGETVTATAPAQFGK